jgi:hypothetical protein
MKKSTNKTRQPRKIMLRQETIACLTSPQLDNIVGASVFAACTIRSQIDPCPPNDG